MTDVDLRFRTASSDQDLEQILTLQRANVEEALDPAEVAEEGFVTVRHDLDLLRAMNDAAPHVIATSGGEVVGYALVMLREFADRIPVLDPMFEMLDGLVHRGRPVPSYTYFVMGQVCVAKPFRGKGTFGGMFRTMRDTYSGVYEFTVTEVARRNARSVRAHEKVGFELLYRYRDRRSGEEWDLIVWDWR